MQLQHMNILLACLINPDDLYIGTVGNIFDYDTLLVCEINVHSKLNYFLNASKAETIDGGGRNNAILEFSLMCDLRLLNSYCG